MELLGIPAKKGQENCRESVHHSGEKGHLVPQGSRLRDPVKPQQFAPFARRTVPQRLDGLDSGQGHEGEQQKDAVESVITGRQFKILGMRKQSHAQKSGQSEQNPAIGDIKAALKFRHGRPGLEQACKQPACGVRCPHADRSCSTDFAPLALAAAVRLSISVGGLSSFFVVGAICRNVPPCAGYRPLNPVRLLCW